MARPKVKAVFIDLDGTLFDSEHRISERTVAVLHTLKERGVAFVVATGRPYTDVFGNLAAAALCPDVIVTSNGARVHDARHAVIFECNMCPDSVRRIFQISPHLTDDGTTDLAVPARRLLLNVNCGDRWFTNLCVPEVRAAFHPSYIYEQVDPAAHTAESLQGTHSMWVRGAHDDLACVKKFVDRELSGKISCTFAQPYILDCFPAGMHKGVAMGHVCAHLGILTSEAIAFGDGMNDVQMLRTAGQGYVMANAAEMVKEAAAGLPVIHSNNEEGVARQLEALLAADAFTSCWPDNVTASATLRAQDPPL
ncbi:haloacid dehalogenase-like hydrolase-like protein [Novymonas esmeraldas]|uniref:Haloacid dehalogenase-like hydrolase-like protein n=1 Tax=Novymonas esmeraldas TaxID=1808958 RepID=A0AAW0EQA0_9TRYP